MKTTKTAGYRIQFDAFVPAELSNMDMLKIVQNFTSSMEAGAKTIGAEISVSKTTATRK